MPRDIQRDEVQRLMQSGAQLLDAMSREDFEESHLPGAINIPIALIRPENIEQLDNEKPTITYCYDTQ